MDMQSRNDEDSRRKVINLIGEIQVAQLVTVGPDGKMHARPMVAKQPDGNDLWFFTSASSGKIEEIEAHEELLLAYSDPRRQHYVTVHGKGEVVRDRTKVRELWSETVRVWFPKGVEDPDLVLLRVTPTEAEYWDSPSSTLVHVYGYAKAVLTGERPQAGEVAHVDFSER